MLLLPILILMLSQSASAYTQDNFVHQLLLSHEFFEKERINVEIKKIEMIGDRANYSNWDWGVGAEFGRIHKNKLKYDYTSSTDYARSTNQQVRKISSDLSKKFFSNGSELSFSFDRSLPIKNEKMYDKNGYQTDKNTTEYLDDLSVSWTLPLLQNQNGVVDQKTYDLAVLDYKDEELVLAEVQEDFIEDKVAEFIDWVEYKWQIEVLSNTISRLSSIQVQMTDRQTRDSEILERSIDKHQRLLLSLKSKLIAQNALLLSAVNGLDVDKNIPTLGRQFSVNLIDNLDQYCQTMVRDLKRINIEIRKNNRSIETYKNSKLPDFDFTISATKDDNKGNYTSYSKSTETEYEAKLVFSYPLSGDINNQVYLDKYRLKSRQFELKYNNKLNDIIANAKKIATDIKQGQIQLSLIGQQLQTLDPNHELNLYFKGQGEIRFVISEIDDYQDLRLEEVVMLIGLYKNKLEYDSLLDRLLPN